MTKKTSKSDPFAEREAAKYEQPIASREFILAHLKRRGSPASLEELFNELELKGEQADIALHRRLKAMVRDEELERLPGGYFWPAGQRILITGRVHIDKGKMSKTWVIPEDGSARILLPTKETHAVYQGNRVIASVLDLKELNEDNIRQGNLVEILEQQPVVITGRFLQDQGVFCVIPHSKEFQQDIIIPPGKEKGAVDGQIVVVSITRHPGRWSETMGEVVEILGHENTPGIEIIAATRAYNLPEQWPIEVIKESETYPNHIPVEATKGRLDIRHLPLVTIDGEDARDFDDAVYCEAKPGGGWLLYVAIADVSHYVQPDSALDKEAKSRGTSVYFPGKVIPMLPEVLSNGLCSLNPEVDRLCLVAILNISKTGRINSYEFFEAVMRSHARLTYTKVAALLDDQRKDGRKDGLEDRNAFLMPHLKNLYQLYDALKEARQVRGAIDFETIETRVIFDPKGKISHIQPVIRNDAHRIIEECMLCANVATAKFLKKHKLPGLYRIHEAPPEDKLVDLRKFLSELGLVLGGGKTPEPIDYASLLRSIQKREDANIIQTVLLRSLSQAIYSPDNVGHFGLAYPAYCHFTSPIRRYPDLLVHRQIKTILRGEWTEEKRTLAHAEDAMKALAALGEHSSMTERRADDATRDALRWLKCEYIQKHLGEEFDGLISGVTRFGFFVELKDIYVDGLVHVTSLKSDYYFFDPAHHRLVGERSGVIFRLGDSVKVRVISVDVDQRKIDFELMEAALAATKKQRHKQRQQQRQPQRQPEKKKQGEEQRQKGQKQRETQRQKEKQKRGEAQTQKPSSSEGQTQKQEQTQKQRKGQKQKQVWHKEKLERSQAKNKDSKQIRSPAQAKIGKQEKSSVDRSQKPGKRTRRRKKPPNSKAYQPIG